MNESRQLFMQTLVPRKLATGLEELITRANLKLLKGEYIPSELRTRQTYIYFQTNVPRELGFYLVVRSLEIQRSLVIVLLIPAIQTHFNKQLFAVSSRIPAMSNH